MSSLTGFSSDIELGAPGFTFADLHNATRLRDLYECFCREVACSNAAFWVEWERYLREPDAPRRPTELSSLLVRMAPHVSRFLARLFHIEADAEELARATRAEEALFRFKVEFVRRRVLPLVKAGAGDARVEEIE